MDKSVKNNMLDSDTNTAFLPQTMTNYIFLHNQSIMSGAANVLILSLLNEFLSIVGCKDFVHNIELSQYFVIENLENSCINCEIVLRYSNTVIPAKKPVQETKYYFFDRNDLQGKKIGLVEFFVKKSYDKSIVYDRIEVVRLTNNLSLSEMGYYIYAEKLDSIKKISDQAICRCLTDALNATYNSGEITCGDASKFADLTDMAKELVNQSVKSSQKLQNHKLSVKNIDSLIGPDPSDHMKDLVQIVDQTVQSIEESKKSVLTPNMDIVTILVPNNAILELNINSNKNGSRKIYLSVSADIAIIPRRDIDKNISILHKINSTIYCVSDSAPSIIPDTIPSKALKPCRKCEQISSIVTDIVQSHRKN